MAVAEGFSLHADTVVHGHDRQGLERLCRYGARGPVSECRLRRLEDGRYEYTPKKGVTFTLTAEALVRRLVALLPKGEAAPDEFPWRLRPQRSVAPVVAGALVLAKQVAHADPRKQGGTGLVFEGARAFAHAWVRHGDGFEDPSRLPQDPPGRYLLHPSAAAGHAYLELLDGTRSVVLAASACSE